MKQTYIELVLMAATDHCELTDYELDTALDYFGWADDTDEYFN